MESARKPWAMEEREGQRLELAAAVSSLSWGRHSE